MRHLMPIITPRLIMRPPTLGDLDSMQTAKEEAWPDLQRWMTWALDNQRSRQAMEDSIRRTMDYQKPLHFWDAARYDSYLKLELCASGPMLSQPPWHEA
jgi:hypothetical protein